MVKYIFFTLIGILLIYCLIVFTGISFDEIYHRCSNIRLSYILSILAFTCFVAFINSYRWLLIVQLITDKATFPKGFFFYYSCLSILATYFVSQTFGNIGVKTLSLKYKHDIRLIEGSVTGVIEHLLNITVFIVLTLPSLLFITRLLPGLWAISIAILFILLIFFLLHNNYHWMIKVITLSLSLIKKLINKLHISGKYSNRDLLSFDLTRYDNRKYAMKLLFYSILLFLSHILRFYLFAGALNINIPLLAFILTFPLVYFITAIGVTPGSLGITEFGWLGVLLLIGVNEDQASLYVIGQRILNIISMLIVFIFGYIYYTYNQMVSRKFI